MTTNPEQDRPVDQQPSAPTQDPGTPLADNAKGSVEAAQTQGTAPAGNEQAAHSTPVQAPSQAFPPAPPVVPSPPAAPAQPAEAGLPPAPPAAPPAHEQSAQPSVLQGQQGGVPETVAAHTPAFAAAAHGGEHLPHSEQHTTPLHELGANSLSPEGAADNGFHAQAAANHTATGHGGGMNGAVGGATGSDSNAHPKSRTGALLAGLAIGALLGGAVGGGVAAVVASNVSQPSTAQGSGSNGTITLNNAENATAISGVAAVALPSVVTLDVRAGNASGSGSGVVYSSDGYIVTNAHVVTLDGAAASGQTIRVKLSDGRILDGAVVGIDPYADLAVVKVDATDLPAIQVANSDKIDVGDLTVAIGAPLNLANTVTSGVVSALNRGISVQSSLIPQQGGQSQDDGSSQDPWDFRYGLPDGSQQQQGNAGTATLPVIQTDASINPGNSGGALLNGKGELIGINVAIASTAGSSGTAGSDGLGFAIPANLVTRVVDAIIAGEQPTHGLMGASVADSSQDTDEDANRAGGLLVDIVQGGAADKAGLKVGDVITAVDGVPAVDGTSVSALVRMHEGGSTVTIDYTRGGKPGQTEVTLGELSWSPQG